MVTFVSHVTLDQLSTLEQNIPPHSPVSTSAADGEQSTALKAISRARNKGYDAICLPLTNEKWKTRWQEMCLLPAEEVPDKAALEQRAEEWRQRPVFARDEVTVTRLDEAEGMVALVSDWLELDAADDWVRHDAETALNQELSYASYLNMHTAILPPPRNRAYVASYARAVNSCLLAAPFMQLAVRIPIYDPSLIQLGDPLSATSSPPPPSASLLDNQPSIAAWEMWDTIRTICGYHPRLALALDLTPPLPSTVEVLTQWSAEPTRYLFLPASTFIGNAKGYPVLPKGTQTFIRDMMKLQPSVILSGADTGRHNRGGEMAYSQYVRHLEKTSASVKASQTAGTVEHFAHGYQDYLQAPLQPLMDNLQSITYQTFEQDPVKYRQYEEAVFQALRQWPASERIVICVAGAGRGPLVARCLSAKRRANRPEVVVYAVEKNPNAYVTLQERKRNEWEDEVTLLFGDMRTLNVPEKVDILVSELLGSFGDNELSPECLDGAMRFLKPEGISIPASYTAYLAPISSSKLYNEVQAGKDEKSAETPYVVMFQNISILSGGGGGISGRCGDKVQACWEFEHPRRDAVLNEQGLPPTNSHNARSTKLTFHIPHASVLHGLAGYFEAVLYGNIGLSIHPERMSLISKDMLSWFPLFFPLKEPLYLPSKCELQVSMWRLTDQRQVWYEWYAEAFLPLPDLLLGLSRSSTPPQGIPSTPPRQNGSRHNSAFLSVAGTPNAAPSPLMEVNDILQVSEEGDVRMHSDESEKEDGENESRIGLVKVGQTSLHNPKGRSSWIGL